VHHYVPEMSNLSRRCLLNLGGQKKICVMCVQRKRTLLICSPSRGMYRSYRIHQEEFIEMGKSIFLYILIAAVLKPPLEFRSGKGDVFLRERLCLDYRKTRELRTYERKTSSLLDA
jgi:hypothetical protein